jgi:hypothetical protein
MTSGFEGGIYLKLGGLNNGKRRASLIGLLKFGSGWIACVGNGNPLKVGLEDC